MRKDAFGASREMTTAKPETLVTYKRSDGEPIDGFDWVTGPEWFDDIDRPMELVKEVWERQSVEKVVHTPS